MNQGGSPPQLNVWWRYTKRTATMQSCVVAWSADFREEVEQAQRQYVATRQFEDLGSTVL
jgi:hypothetical protein